MPAIAQEAEHPNWIQIQPQVGSVSEWIAGEARRVAAHDFAPEVRKMYASAMRLSPRFAAGFRDFWNLAPDFTFEAEG